MSDKDDAALPSFTRSQVARHNTAEDLWIIVNGWVYDVTSFLYEHPGELNCRSPLCRFFVFSLFFFLFFVSQLHRSSGGESAFLDHAGKDGTKAYKVVYNHEYAENLAMLKTMKVGKLAETDGVDIDAMKESDMLHTSLGHSTVSGPPHVLIGMSVILICGLIVHYVIAPATMS